MQALPRFRRAASYLLSRESDKGSCAVICYLASYTASRACESRFKTLICASSEDNSRLASINCKIAGLLIHIISWPLRTAVAQAFIGRLRTLAWAVSRRHWEPGTPLKRSPRNASNCGWHYMWGQFVISQSPLSSLFSFLLDLSFFETIYSLYTHI